MLETDAPKRISYDYRQKLKAQAAAAMQEWARNRYVRQITDESVEWDGDLKHFVVLIEVA